MTSPGDDPGPAALRPAASNTQPIMQARSATLPTRATALGPARPAASVHAQGPGYLAPQCCGDTGKRPAPFDRNPDGRRRAPTQRRRYAAVTVGRGPDDCGFAARGPYPSPFGTARWEGASSTPRRSSLRQWVAWLIAGSVVVGGGIMAVVMLTPASSDLSSVPVTGEPWALAKTQIQAAGLVAKEAAASQRRPFKSGLVISSRSRDKTPSRSVCARAARIPP